LVYLSNSRDLGFKTTGIVNQTRVTYNPIFDTQIDASYQPLSTYGVAPGAIFSAFTGSNANFPSGYEENINESWAIYYFEIPTDGVADTLTVNYTADEFPLDPNRPDLYSGFFETTTQIIIDQKAPVISEPFDKKFMKSSQLFSLNEKLEIGELATVVVNSQSSNPDNSIPVSITITSKDKGYPIQVDSYSYTYLIYQNGVNCSLAFFDNPENWPGDNLFEIGPSQSATVTGTFSNPDNLHVWIVLQLELSETNVANSSTTSPKIASENYIVQIK
jgi:hypothetical protein